MIELLPSEVPYYQEAEIEVFPLFPTVPPPCLLLGPCHPEAALHRDGTEEKLNKHQGSTGSLLEVSDGSWMYGMDHGWPKH